MIPYKPIGLMIFIGSLIFFFIGQFSFWSDIFGGMIGNAIQQWAANAMIGAALGAWIYYADVILPAGPLMLLIAVIITVVFIVGGPYILDYFGLGGLT